MMVTQDVNSYNPDTVDRWLRRWDELIALSESPRSARHLQDPQCSTGHSCSYGSPVGIRAARGMHGDPNRYSDILADLEKAWSSLRFNSLGWRVVDMRMRTAGIHRWRNPTTHAREEEPSAALDAIALALGVRAELVRDAYKMALKDMARYLGWVDSDVR